MSAKIFYAGMIAGTHSSVGKTVWSLALMELARQKGLAVQPFKAGPDYIDPGFHHLICAPRKSRNLDLHLLSSEEVKKCFERNSQSADFSLVEGMMGLFDGKTISGQETSSAAIAKLLDLPVLLVLDGAGLATSAAAIVLGFQKYDPELRLAGVLINRVRHESHFAWLKKAIEEKTGVPCLGYLPPEETFHIPERHLGLKTAVESENISVKIRKAAEFLQKSLDWERLTSVIAGSEPAIQPGDDKSFPDSFDRCRIAVAYDPAFSFYYEDNFDLLKRAGAEIHFFSPMQDTALPAGAGLLYFGGGFPEVYAARLSLNVSMKQAIRDFYSAGGLIYAECGGFIYLTEAFEDSSQTSHPLVGLIPGKIRMSGKLQNFGYQDPVGLTETFLFPAGTKLKSHEFHYSIWDCPQKIQQAYQIGERFDGFAAERLLASYQHLHFGSDPKLAERLVSRCIQNRRGQAVAS